MLVISGYNIQEQLYESGHSIVYRGQREADDHPVILKLLKNEYPSPEEPARFRWEYEITRSLDLNGVIKVTRYNLHCQQDGWQPIQVGIGVHVGDMMVGMVDEAARAGGCVFR